MQDFVKLAHLLADPEALETLLLSTIVPQETVQASLKFLVHRQELSGAELTPYLKVLRAAANQPHWRESDLIEAHIWLRGLVRSFDPLNGKPTNVGDLNAFETALFGARQALYRHPQFPLDLLRQLTLSAAAQEDFDLLGFLLANPGLRHQSVVSDIFESPALTALFQQLEESYQLHYQRLAIIQRLIRHLPSPHLLTILHIRLVAADRRNGLAYQENCLADFLANSVTPEDLLRKLLTLDLSSQKIYDRRPVWTRLLDREFITDEEILAAWQRDQDWYHPASLLTQDYAFIQNLLCHRPRLPLLKRLFEEIRDSNGQHLFPYLLRQKQLTPEMAFELNKINNLPASVRTVLISLCR